MTSTNATKTPAEIAWYAASAAYSRSQAAIADACGNPDYDAADEAMEVAKDAEDEAIDMVTNTMCPGIGELQVKLQLLADLLRKQHHFLCGGQPELRLIASLQADVARLG